MKGNRVLSILLILISYIYFVNAEVATYCESGSKDGICYLKEKVLKGLKNCSFQSQNDCRMGDYVNAVSCISCMEETEAQDGEISCTCDSNIKKFVGPCKNLKYSSETKQLECDSCSAGVCKPGTHLTSCYDCSYDKDRESLSCYCRNSDNKAKLTTWNGKCNVYENNNGNLVCKDSSKYCTKMDCRPGEYYYSKTCRDCVESDPLKFEGKIKCKCEHERALIESTYNGHCKDLRNHKGKLTCYEKCPLGNCREGDYINKCIDCREHAESQDGLIECKCLLGNDVQPASSYTGSCANLQSSLRGKLYCPAHEVGKTNQKTGCPSCLKKFQK